MDNTHRRIELQSPADLQHIVSLASRAARSKIDLHFPPRAGITSTSTPPDDAAAALLAIEDDPLRKRVEALVQEFLERTFAGVRGNVSVNGLEGADMERELRAATGEEAGQETEAFDHLLARRVQAVSSQVEGLTLQLATLRREVPAKTAERYTRRMEEEEKGWEERMSRGVESDRKRAEEVDLAIDGLEDVEGMRRSWDEGTRRLVEVKDRVGGVQARLEKARDAVGYLASA